MNFDVSRRQHNLGYYHVARRQATRRKDVSVHLRFYKVALPFFVVLHDLGMKRIYGAS